MPLAYPWGIQVEYAEPKHAGVGELSELTIASIICAAPDAYSAEMWKTSLLPFATSKVVAPMHTRARENEKKETLNSNTTIIIVEKLFFSSVVVIEQSNNG